MFVLTGGPVGVHSIYIPVGLHVTLIGYILINTDRRLLYIDTVRSGIR